VRWKTDVAYLSVCSQSTPCLMALNGKYSDLFNVFSFVFSKTISLMNMATRTAWYGIILGHVFFSERRLEEVTCHEHVDGDYGRKPFLFLFFFICLLSLTISNCTI
jgi:hypothetical protein